MFKVSDCYIPEVWCGDSDTIPRHSVNRRYTRKGTRRECLKKGFGAGMYTEKNKSLNPTSLQQIKYIGERYEQRFDIIGNIRSTTQLINYAKTRNSNQIDRFLKRILVKSNQVIDQRAYNMVVLFLYQKGVRNVPRCTRI